MKKIPSDFNVQKYIERQITVLIERSGMTLNNGGGKDDLVQKVLDKDDSDDDKDMFVMSSTSNEVNSSFAGLNSQNNAHLYAQTNTSPSVSKGSTGKKKWSPTSREKRPRVA